MIGARHCLDLGLSSGSRLMHTSSSAVSKAVKLLPFKRAQIIAVQLVGPFTKILSPNFTQIFYQLDPSIWGPFFEDPDVFCR